MSILSGGLYRIPTINGFDFGTYISVKIYVISLTTNVDFIAVGDRVGETKNTSFSTAI